MAVLYGCPGGTETLTACSVVMTTLSAGVLWCLPATLDTAKQLYLWPSSNTGIHFKTSNTTYFN